MNSYFIQLRLRSAMQIGAGSLGMIEKTLLWIPSKVIWGAFTNTLAQMLFEHPSADQYLSVGQAVSSGRISYFFPEIKAVRMLPVYPEKKWIDPEKGKQTLSFAEMEAAILTSVMSTALTPECMSAKDHTLHATDLIRQFTLFENEPLTNTVLSGYMELPETIEGTPVTEKLITDVFDLARIGGGRKRGWGMVDAAVCRKSYEGFTEIELQVPKGKLLTADMPFKPDVKVCGEIKLLSRREYHAESGSGQQFSKPELLWSAGSMIFA